jgi:hypothetical protein
MKTLQRTLPFIRVVILIATVVVGLGLASQPATTAAAPQLTQLTTGGCCSHAYWSANSQQVLYIDKPTVSAPVGIYGVDVAHPQTPRLVTPRITFYAHQMSLAIDVKPGSTIIESVADGKRWSVPAGGAVVSVSPNEKRIAWDTGVPFPPEARVARIHVANFDGSGAKIVATVNRGGIGGWISDDMLLVSGRTSVQSREQVLYSLSVVTGELKPLVSAEGLRGGNLSPDGAWLAYQVAPNPDPAKNGLWLMKTDGTGQFHGSPDLFGPVQWRDAHRLLIVPFRPTAESHEVWELDVTTQQTRRLIDPAVTPFKIDDGDWAVSPDGRTVAFVSAQDRNLWLLSLPQ